MHSFLRMESEDVKYQHQLSFNAVMEERGQSFGKHRASLKTCILSLKESYPHNIQVCCNTDNNALLLFSVAELKHVRDLTTKNEEF